ncbi:MAG: CHAT domain-containing protein [Pseudomonadota bacterium]
MRVSFQLQAGMVVSTVEVGTLFHKQSQPYLKERIEHLSREAIKALSRGTCHQSSSESGLREMRLVGEQLASILVPKEIASRFEGAQSMFLHVDESLVQIPWELLCDGERFWCESFDLGRAVATPQPIVGRTGEFPTVGPLRILVICDNHGGELQQVIPEGEALLSRLDEFGAVAGDLLVNPKVEIVRRRLKDYDLVHFAGHADHDSKNPENSGWHFGDGKFTAAEVVALASGRSMPLLVFSNACSSSQTDAWIEEESASGIQVYGLANAFLLSGVRLYLGTQWEVVDSQSARFALAFYEALSRGACAGAAMRIAREDGLRSACGLGWASYVLYGDPQLVPVQWNKKLVDRAVLPSSRRLEARLTTPWKRQRATDSLRLSNVVKKSFSIFRKRGYWFLGMLFVCVVCIVFSWGYYNREKLSDNKSEPFALEKLARDTNLEHSTLVMEETDLKGRVLPLVAVAVGPLESTRNKCIWKLLEKSQRFRLVAKKQIRQFAQEQGLDWSKPLTMDLANALGQALSADLVFHELEYNREIAVFDVLIGEIIFTKKIEKLGGAVCKELVAKLVKIIHSEGQVIAVLGKRVTIDLGWRSRVSPGARMVVIRGGKQVGILIVEQVEMERCVAQGNAQIGDLVRPLP